MTRLALCPGYEGVYAVSDSGDVVRIARARGTRNGLVLSQCVDGRGYATVGFAARVRKILGGRRFTGWCA